MKWITDNQSSEMISRFQLTDGQEKFGEIKISRQNKTVRVEFPEKRLFFFEPAGIFQHKILFKNEYGQDTGSIFSKDGQSGFVTLPEEVFHFHHDEQHLFLETKGGLYAVSEKISVNDPQLVSVIIFIHAWLFQKGRLQVTPAENELASLD